MWTIDRVKQELPDIKVQRGDGKIVAGYVRGRKLPFAKVVVNGTLAVVEVAWSVLAHLLNTDKPLII